MKKVKVKKLVINRETLAKLQDEQLLKAQGGTWIETWICNTSAGAGFCNHAC